MADDPVPAAPQPPAAAQQQPSKTRQYMLLAAVAVGLLFILINSRSVKINFIFGSVQMSLFFALALSTLIGVVIGYLMAKFGERN